MKKYEDTEIFLTANKMPKPNEAVLGYQWNIGFWAVVAFDEKEERWFYPSNEYWCNAEITHWAVLPEEPKSRYKK